MDFIHKCYATIHYKTRVVRFELPNKIKNKWGGCGPYKQSHIISNLMSNKMLSKG